MSAQRAGRRSFLVQGMSTAAGTWVLGSQALALLFGTFAQSGCDPRVKYGGPEPRLEPDGAPGASGTAAPLQGQDDDAGDTPGPSASGSAAPPASASAVVTASATAPTPPKPKYGGPRPQPKKYGGRPSGDLEW